MFKVALVTATLCLSVTVFADQGQKSDRGARLTFEEVKASCQSPSKFHNQAAPQNIQISCQDTQYKWVPDSEGTLTLDTGRVVTSSLGSDKYFAEPVSNVVPTSPQVVTCARYKQV